MSFVILLYNIKFFLILVFFIYENSFEERTIFVTGHWDFKTKFTVKIMIYIDFIWNLNFDEFNVMVVKR